jgi:hypothetical protein
MLNKNNIIMSFVLVLFTLSSCENNNKDDLRKTTNIYLTFSQEQATLGNYNNVYKQANDTVEHWVKSGVTAYEYIRINTWHIDSLICFNRKADKCVMALFKQSTFNEDSRCRWNNIFIRRKIYESWYFFTGAYIVLPREFYQKDIHTPLSFDKLHEIAMREVYSGYLIKHKKDAGFWNNTFAPQYEYEVNDAWFDQIGTAKDYVYTKQDSLRMTPELLDSIIILNAYSNWLPANKQNIGFTTPSKWNYFYKTPYPLSLPGKIIRLNHVRRSVAIRQRRNKRPRHIARRRGPLWCKFSDSVTCTYNKSSL